MKIFLTTAYPFHSERNFAVKWLSESAKLDPYKKHVLVKDPSEAEIVLFVEHHPGEDPYFFKVFSSEIFKRFRQKCLLYHDCDWAIPLIPGIYPSLERRANHLQICEPGHYIARLCENQAIRFITEKPKPEFLFSFVGAGKTHSVRSKVLNLKHPRCFLEDTSGKHSWELTSREKEIFEKKYVEVSQRSKFILCPRGVGPSTYRLFESMEMGICPVIISDEWVPVSNLKWEKFSIRIPESQVNDIPNILEEQEDKAEAMGKLARVNWEKFFSKEVSFHHLTEISQRLHIRRQSYKPKSKIKLYSNFLSPFHFRNLIRYTKKQLMNKRDNLLAYQKNQCII